MKNFGFINTDLLIKIVAAIFLLGVFYAQMISSTQSIKAEIVYSREMFEERLKNVDRRIDAQERLWDRYLRLTIVEQGR